MKGLGWRKEHADPRDLRHGDIPEVSDRIAATQELPEVNFFKWIPPVKDQGNLNSCVAHGIAGAYEFDGVKTTGRYTPISRLYLYKAARRLGGFTGDSGAYIRDGMRALVRLGAPPEALWPYKIEAFDAPPDFVASGYAQNFEALRYVRLKNLTEIKAYIRAGFPVVFGFTVFPSIEQVKEDGWVPLPKPGDKPVGGHAVYTCAYSNLKKSGYWPDPPGALGFMNSWGNWGDKGKGWLPYEYFSQGFCDDFWALISARHPDDREFSS
jgi:C1A family cysteine protease